MKSSFCQTKYLIIIMTLMIINFDHLTRDMNIDSIMDLLVTLTVSSFLWLLEN